MSTQIELTDEVCAKLRIKRTQAVRGGKGFMGTCPNCGKRKRLNGRYPTSREREILWFLACSCGAYVEIGSTRRVEEMAGGEGA